MEPSHFTRVVCAYIAQSYRAFSGFIADSIREILARKGQTRIVKASGAKVPMQSAGFALQ